VYEWHSAVETLRERMVRIATHSGSGSGFFLPWKSKSRICAVATAAHVIDHAFYWEQPIRIDHVAAGKSTLLREGQRAIVLDQNRDTAIVVFEVASITPPSDDLPFVPIDKHLKVGNEVGWLGFPAIASSLCFFSGRVSSYIEENQSYLIDGVAINGVSGGLVFHLAADSPAAVGVLSAYIANRTTGEALPGLSVARNVRALLEQAKSFEDFDSARASQSVPEPPSASPTDKDIQPNPTRSGA
jgi:hypothetical protein